MIGLAACDATCASSINYTYGISVLLGAVWFIVRVPHAIKSMGSTQDYSCSPRRSTE